MDAYLNLYMFSIIFCLFKLVSLNALKGVMLREATFNFFKLEGKAIFLLKEY